MSRKLTFKTSKSATKQKYVDNMTDISFDMTASQSDLGVIYDMTMLSIEDSIKQSLINSLQVGAGGNVLFPESGYDFINLIFKRTSDVEVQRNAIKSYISDAEPRINIDDFTIDFVTNDYNETEANFTLKYRILNGEKLYQLNVTLQNNLNNI